MGLSIPRVWEVGAGSRYHAIMAKLIALIVLACVGFSGVGCAGPAYFANGVKVGEVTAGSAIVWTRLGASETFDPNTYRIEPSAGAVRLIYWPKGDEDAAVETAWVDVDPADDSTHRFELKGLKADTAYAYRLLARQRGSTAITDRLSGEFKTAPVAGEAKAVTFAVLTGQKFRNMDDPPRGHRVYKTLLGEDLDFMVHTGDIVYYDNDKPGPVARSVGEARAHWHRLYNLQHERAFHRRVPSYFIKDDHDTLKNDCWPGQRAGELTFAQGVALFKEQNPVGEVPYRTVRWGRDLQVWFAEGREFRSANPAPDGPGKTIWGAEQVAWFKRTVEASDATYKVLVSATPIVGPDRGNKNDNHANKGFKHEGDWLRRYLKDRGVHVVCGDRHWQYVSVDGATGLWEFSCGPTSDKHAGGWNPNNKLAEHKFLRVKGGYLLVKVRPAANNRSAVLTFEHHGVDGKMHHQVNFGGH